MDDVFDVLPQLFAPVVPAGGLNALAEAVLVCREPYRNRLELLDLGLAFKRKDRHPASALNTPTTLANALKVFLVLCLTENPRTVLCDLHRSQHIVPENLPRAQGGLDVLHSNELVFVAKAIVKHSVSDTR